jgi:hypothetical protein
VGAVLIFEPSGNLRIAGDSRCAAPQPCSTTCSSLALTPADSLAQAAEHRFNRWHARLAGAGPGSRRRWRLPGGPRGVRHAASGGGRNPRAPLHAELAAADQAALSEVRGAAEPFERLRGCDQARPVPTAHPATRPPMALAWSPALEGGPTSIHRNRAR